MPRFSDYPTANEAASDDYLLIDGVTNKTRKLKVSDIIGDETSMNFEIVNSYDQAVSPDTIYFSTSGGMVFVMKGSGASAIQYRFSLLQPTLVFRTCQIEGGVVTSASEWKDIVAENIENKAGFEFINNYNEAVSEGVIYYNNNDHSICLVSKSSTKARQFVFGINSGAIMTRSASVSGGTVSTYSDWSDIVTKKMDLLTDELLVPYDYDEELPDVSSQEFIDLDIGQLFMCNVFTGSQTIKTFWRKASANTCDALSTIDNTEIENELKNKVSKNQRIAGIYLRDDISSNDLYTAMFDSINPNQIVVGTTPGLPAQYGRTKDDRKPVFCKRQNEWVLLATAEDVENNTHNKMNVINVGNPVPANSAGTRPNTSSGEFNLVQVGAIFPCILDNITTYWIKTTSFTCTQLSSGSSGVKCVKIAYSQANVNTAIAPSTLYSVEESGMGQEILIFNAVGSQRLVQYWFYGYPGGGIQYRSLVRDSESDPWDTTAWSSFHSFAEEDDVVLSDEKAESTLNELTNDHTLYNITVDGGAYKVFCVTIGNKRTQYKFNEAGVISSRTQTRANNSWGAWGDWVTISSTKMMELPTTIPAMPDGTYPIGYLKDRQIFTTGTGKYYFKDTRKDSGYVEICTDDIGMMRLVPTITSESELSGIGIGQLFYYNVQNVSVKGYYIKYSNVNNIGAQSRLASYNDLPDISSKVDKTTRVANHELSDNITTGNLYESLDSWFIESSGSRLNPPTTVENVGVDSELDTFYSDGKSKFFISTNSGTVWALMSAVRGTPSGTPQMVTYTLNWSKIFDSRSNLPIVVLITAPVNGSRGQGGTIAEDGQVGYCIANQTFYQCAHTSGTSWDPSVTWTVISRHGNVTVWDAATSSLNNYEVPITQAGELGDIIILTPGTGLGGETWWLEKIITNITGTKSYYWTKNVGATELTNKLANKVDKTTTIANIALSSDITSDQLRRALDVQGTSYVDGYSSIIDFDADVSAGNVSVGQVVAISYGSVYKLFKVNTLNVDSSGSTPVYTYSLTEIGTAPNIFFGNADKPNVEYGNDVKAYNNFDRYINTANGKLWICEGSEVLANGNWRYTWTYKGIHLDVSGKMDKVVFISNLDSAANLDVGQLFECQGALGYITDKGTGYFKYRTITTSAETTHNVT